MYVQKCQWRAAEDQTLSVKKSDGNEGNIGDPEPRKMEREEYKNDNKYD